MARWTSRRGPRRRAASLHSGRGPPCRGSARVPGRAGRGRRGARSRRPSGWSGGARTPTDGHMARGGHAARSRRDLLLPALHAVQDQDRLDQPAGARLHLPAPEPCRRPRRTASRRSTPSSRPASDRRIVAHVCDDIACRLAGAEDTCADLERRSGRPGPPPATARTTWLRSPCLGLLRAGTGGPVHDRRRPPLGASPRPRSMRSGSSTGSTTCGPGSPMRNASPDAGFQRRPRPRSCPRRSLENDETQAGLRLRLLPGSAGSIPASPTPTGPPAATTHSRGRSRWARRRSIDEVTGLELLGRGGAAFPTGRKWAAVAAQPARPHYLVCNADESEPGTFKDRVLMEDDPFAVVEGMTIEGFATGASHGYLYLRGEYPLAADRMADAIVAARRRACSGRTSLGSGFAFDIELRAAPAPTSAARRRPSSSRSRAAVASRGTSRPSRSRSACSASRRRSTTSRRWSTCRSSCVDGGAAFAAIGTEGSTGPKLFCLSGHVTRPGVYEVPFGMTLRELHRPGRRRPRRRGDPGDPARRRRRGRSSVRTPSTRRSRSRGRGPSAATLGSGVVMVFDDSTDLVDILRRIAAFFRDESCGQCVPCRVGTVRQEELLARLAAGTADRRSGRTSWPSCARSARRCATRRSAASARRPRRPSRAPCVRAVDRVLSRGESRSRRSRSSPPGPPAPGRPPAPARAPPGRSS